MKFENIKPGDSVVIVSKTGKYLDKPEIVTVDKVTKTTFRTYVGTFQRTTGETRGCARYSAHTVDELAALRARHERGLVMKKEEDEKERIRQAGIAAINQANLEETMAAMDGSLPIVSQIDQPNGDKVFFLNFLPKKKEKVWQTLMVSARKTKEDEWDSNRGAYQIYYSFLAGSGSGGGAGSGSYFDSIEEGLWRLVSDLYHGW